MYIHIYFNKIKFINIIYVVIQYEHKSEGHSF